MFRNLCLFTAGLALCASSASAQNRINELYVSMAGTDSEEFVEIRGTPGASLNGYMFLVVEGDGTLAGTLDIAIDLSAGTLDANGLYTAGSALLVPPVNQVFGPVSGQNLIENGTDTFYLIETTNVPGVMALVGTDLRVGLMGTVTVLATDPAITIRDLVALTDGGATDVTFDNAQVFQDGTFLPAGVVRCGDAPSVWNAMYLAFSSAAPTVTEIAVTHGAVNPACGIFTGTEFCFGDGAGLACPCANNSTVGNNDGCLNSLGTGGRLRVAGNPSLTNDTIVLTGSQMPNSSALYFQGTTQQGGGNGVLFGDGLRCAGGAIVRLGTKNNTAGTSSYPTGGDAVVSVRGLVTMPGIRTYQCWYRNAAAFCTTSTFNLSNGIEIPWGA